MGHEEAGEAGEAGGERMKPIRNSQFAIRNSQLNQDRHNGKRGFYLPWDTRTVSLRDATANAPLAGVSA